MAQADEFFKEGTTHFQASRWAPAAESYRRAIERDPLMGPAWFERGKANFKLGRWDESIADFSRAIELEPHKPWVHTNLGEALFLRGKLSEASAAFRKAIERSRNREVASNELGAALALLSITLLQQKKYAEAEPPLRECVNIRMKEMPDHWLTFNARSMLGAALWGQQKHVEAEPLLIQGYEGMKQRETSVPPEGKARLTEALERLVALYEATGQKDKAAAWRKKLSERKG